MKDRYGRDIDYMRISITDRCSYRCFYCMPQDDCIDRGGKNILKKKEIVELVSIGAQLGIKKVRITGGEPLIRDDIDEIFGEVSCIEGVEELCITTNGDLLDRKIEVLKECRVKRVNVSLDTLSPEKFKKITKTGDLLRVLRGVEEALRAGVQIRINSVIIEGINEDEIIKLAELTKKYPIDLRFIELMPIGEGRKYRGISGKEIRERILREKSMIKLEGREGVTEYYRLSKGLGRIGFIDPLSSSFCQECNRIRITSQGEVKQCLNNIPTLNLLDIMRSGADREELVKAISREVYNKPEKHRFNTAHPSEELSNMNKIGG